MDNRTIKNHFQDDYRPFYERYLPNLQKSSDDELKAICPFHNDSNPSLSVNSRTGQFYCFGCHKSGDIFTFYAYLHGLNVKVDFERIVKEIGRDLGMLVETKPRIVKTYDYFDESGKLLHQTCRYEPKDFRQRQPDGSNGWIWNLKGITPVLYRLPEIMKAEEIIICEGEKDADALIELGFCATTAPMGAGKWRDGYNAYLKDKHVILMPDNDEQGRKHMHQVGRSLEGAALSLRWLQLPDLPERGDVSDFITACSGTKEAAERLAVMIDGAAKYELRREPETITRKDDLTFPDIMSGAAGEFAEVYSRALEPPIQFFYISFLTCLGTILAGYLTMNSELSVEPRLYSLILGESADDRESTAILKTVNFFSEAAKYFAPCFGVGSAEGLQDVLEVIPNTLLVFDEFRAFVGKCKIQSSVLLPLVTTLFEETFFETHTKKHDIYLEDVHLSILAASTTDTYQQIFDSSFTAIGFTNRMFLAVGTGKRKHAFPIKVNDNDYNRLKKHLSDIFDHVRPRRELSIDDDALALYTDWYMNLPQSVHAKRLDTYAMRFMELLAVNDLKSVIDIETVQKVILLMDWQYRVRRTYDPIDADNKMARVEEQIRRVLCQGSKSERELKRAVHYERCGLWLYEHARDNLKAAGEIFFEESQKKWELI